MSSYAAWTEDILTFHTQQPTLPLADDENQVCVLETVQRLHVGREYYSFI